MDHPPHCLLFHFTDFTIEISHNSESVLIRFCCISWLFIIICLLLYCIIYWTIQLPMNTAHFNQCCLIVFDRISHCLVWNESNTYLFLSPHEMNFFPVSGNVASKSPTPCQSVSAIPIISYHLPYFLRNVCPMWARRQCRISPTCFLAECRKRRPNQGSFVLLCFVLFAFSGLCLVLVMSVFDLSSVLLFPSCTDVSGTV